MRVFTLALCIRTYTLSRVLHRIADQGVPNVDAFSYPHALRFEECQLTRHLFKGLRELQGLVRRLIRNVAGSCHDRT